jgi:hypothetical protein
MIGCALYHKELKTMNGFEKREAVNNNYWEDKRWEKVSKLRDEGKYTEANRLVMTIRNSWGLD